MNNKCAILIGMKLAIAISLITFLSACHAEAKKCNRVPIKIAVIDTGFGFADRGHESHLCQYGHKDFSVDRQFTKNYATHDPIPLDTHGHGTNVTGIIEQYAKEAHINYCIVVIKYYSEQQNGQQNLRSEIRALNYAANIKADYINYSGGGPTSSAFEKAAVKRFLKQGGHFIAAAGNESQDLDIPANAYYPAMYDERIVVVGNLCNDGNKCESSNYGKRVNRWEVGENVAAYGITLTGTSQATAVATGKLVAESDNKCDIGF